jgi:hypothetical protein
LTTPTITANTSFTQITIDGTGTISGVSATGLTTAQTVASAQLPAGSVLQVVSATSTTNNSTTGSTYVAAGLTTSITPKFSTSKILIIVNQNVYISTAGGEAVFTIYKNGADLTSGSGFADTYAGASDLIGQVPMVYLDSPATTSAVTYNFQLRSGSTAAAVYINRTGSDRDTANYEWRTPSNIILMEISG